MFGLFFVLYFVKLSVGNSYCLNVCAIIILKPAGMLYMYQHQTVMRIQTNVDLHIKIFFKNFNIKMSLQTKNNPTHHLLIEMQKICNFPDFQTQKIE